MFVVSGQLLVVSGQWSVVSGQWSVVSGQWSVVSEEVRGKNIYQSQSPVPSPVPSPQLPILDASCRNWLSNGMHFN
jgi:hypothetical protein